MAVYSQLPQHRERERWATKKREENWNFVHMGNGFFYSAIKIVDLAGIPLRTLFFML
jgi:hypothetical protein